MTKRDSILTVIVTTDYLAQWGYTISDKWAAALDEMIMAGKFNPYHEPAGSPIGGQFAEAPGGAASFDEWATSTFGNMADKIIEKDKTNIETIYRDQYDRYVENFVSDIETPSREEGTEQMGRSTQAMRIIKKELEKKDGMTFVGVRGLYKGEGMGYLENSHVWEDGNYTEEMLSGTSTVYVGEYWGEPNFDIKDLEKALRDASTYGDSNNIGIVVGDNLSGGEDIGEGVISNARVIGILKKRK